MSKYGSRKTVVDGITFDSKKESDRYKDLKYLQIAGQISKLEVQPVFILQEAFTKNGHKFSAITYRADFKYEQNGETVIEDVKGMKTEVYRIKRKLFEKIYPYSVIEI
jgi:hypothetical protein